MDLLDALRKVATLSPTVDADELRVVERLSVPGQDRESDQYQESLAVLRPYTAQQRAAPGYGPYSLYGRLMDHTVVRG